MGAAFANKAFLFKHRGFWDYKLPPTFEGQSVEAKIHAIIDNNGLLVKLVCIPIFDNSGSCEDDRNTFDHLYTLN